MLALLSTAAGLMMMPEMGPNLTWHLNDLYPQRAVQREQSGIVLFEYSVAPDGRIFGCKETKVIGDQVFSALVCDEIMGKRVSIPKGPDGQPITALVSSFVKFSIPDTKDGQWVNGFYGTPDLELSVQSLPGVEGEFLDLGLLLGVDAQGKMTDCAPEKQDGAQAGFLTAACQQLTSWNRILPDANGNPVPYVTRLNVRFSKGQAD